MNWNRLLMVLVGLIFFSCEDDITVETPDAQTRLVIDAEIDWQNGTDGTFQNGIILSLSTPFNTNNPFIPVENANLVEIENLNTNQVFTFTHSENGRYETNSFVPIVGNEYELRVDFNNERYTAQETFFSVPTINSIDQSTEGGFDNDAIEVNFRFNDNPDTEDFYLVQYFSDRLGFPVRETFDDEFVNGNEINAFVETSDSFGDDEENLEPGDVVTLKLVQGSELYINFFDLILEQNDSDGPFAVVPAMVRGNIVNETNPDNFAFGYFRLNQSENVSYTVQ